MRKITIIHPSRSRPQEAIATQDKWLMLADTPDNIQYILATDDTDPLLHKYPFDKMWVGPHKSAIEAINAVALMATGDILIVVSDDFDCPLHWDTLLLEAIGDREDFVAKTDDGCQPWIITLPIMDRKYYERFGYIYYPGYEHLFADTEMTHVGDLLGRTINLPIKFQHRHYTQVGGQPKDDINRKNDATWNSGEAVYLERLKTNFGLTEVKDISLPAHHVGWLRAKGVKI